MSVRVLVLTLAAAFALPHPRAHAVAVSGDEAEGDFAVAGRTVRQRGTVAARAATRVTVEGGRATTIGDLARQAFVAQDRFTGEVRAARTHLLAAPAVSDEVVELDESIVLTRKTSFVVTDPVALRAASPTYAMVRGGHAGAMTVRELSATQRAGLTALATEAAGYPDGHPLKTAAAQGEQALLDAIGAGKGEFAMTTTVEIPRGSRAWGLRPVQLSNGAFGKTETVAPGSRYGEPIDILDHTAVDEGGTCTHDFDFLLGFTRTHDWDWTTRFDLPGGFLRVKAAAWFDYGLRIPVQVHAVQTPNRIEATGGDADVPATYGVTLSARTLDAPKSFYTGVGLSENAAHDGKELFLSTGFGVTVTLRIFGERLLHQTFPGNTQIEWGDHFTPPFGDCGSRCGPALWIPAQATRTQIDVLVAKGSAQAGVKLAGDGAIGFAYEAIANDATVESWPGTNRQNKASKPTLSLSSRTAHLTRTAQLDALASGGRLGYGYRLSAPTYTWDLEMIPGIKGTIEIKVWPFKETITIGPFWLDEAAIDLGTLRLAAHEGTPEKAKRTHGLKTYRSGLPSQLVPK